MNIPWHICIAHETPSNGPVVGIDPKTKGQGGAARAKDAISGCSISHTARLVRKSYPPGKPDDFLLDTHLKHVDLLSQTVSAVPAGDVEHKSLSEAVPSVTGP